MVYVFIDLNCFSGEQCRPWASWYTFVFKLSASREMNWINNAFSLYDQFYDHTLAKKTYLARGHGILCSTYL